MTQKMKDKDSSKRDYKKYFEENKGKLYSFENAIIILLLIIFQFLPFILNVELKEMLNLKIFKNPTLLGIFLVFFVFVMKVIDAAINQNIIDDMVEKDIFNAGKIKNNMKNRDLMFHYVNVSAVTVVIEFMFYAIMFFAIFLFSKSNSLLLKAFALIASLVGKSLIEAILYPIDKIYTQDTTKSLQDIIGALGAQLTMSKSYILRSLFKVVLKNNIFINFNFAILIYTLKIPTKGSLYTILQFLAILLFTRFGLRQMLSKRIEANIFLINNNIIIAKDDKGNRLMLGGVIQDKQLPGKTIKKKKKKKRRKK